MEKGIVPLMITASEFFVPVPVLSFFFWGGVLVMGSSARRHSTHSKEANFAILLSQERQNSKAKKGITVLGRVINPDYQGIFDCFSTMVVRNMYGVQGIFGASMSCD